MKALRVMIVILVVVIGGAVSGSGAVLAQMASIAATVNEDAISEADVQARMRLAIISSGLPNNEDVRGKLRPQILGALIDESIRKQAAAAEDITVEGAEINHGFAMIAQQNNLQEEQFRNALVQSGVGAKTLEDQVEAQIAWSKVVQKKLYPGITVSDTEVQAVIDRLHRDIGKAEYLVSEIFLPVENPQQEADVKHMADRLTAQIVQGHAGFARVAGQFSQAAGAAKGGDLGWVAQEQLAQEIGEVLANMGEGEISKPVRSLAGYHILLLRNKRVITEDNIPSMDEMMQRLGMEQLDRLQRRYFLDLKSTAFIEQRD